MPRHYERATSPKSSLSAGEVESGGHAPAEVRPGMDDHQRDSNGEGELHEEIGGGECLT